MCDWPTLSLAGAIPASYVAFLYLFDYAGRDRNAPESVKRRCVAAVLHNVLVLAVTYLLLNVSVEH